MTQYLLRVRDDRDTMEELAKMAVKELQPGARANLVVLTYLVADLLITDILVYRFIGEFIMNLFIYQYLF